jgi:hypothetical protein
VLAGFNARAIAVRSPHGGKDYTAPRAAGGLGELFA